MGTKNGTVTAEPVLSSWVQVGRVIVALLLVVLGGTTARAQTAISGTVVSERTQRPLVGAQVLAQGTGRGTLTDAAGRFVLLGVPGTQTTLRVSMIGFRPVERAARVGETGIQIGMAETAVELDEIVVTGVAGGTQRRAIGNVVSQIRASDVLEQAPVANIQSLLNARTWRDRDTRYRYGRQRLAHPHSRRIQLFTVQSAADRCGWRTSGQRRRHRACRTGIRFERYFPVERLQPA